MCFASYETKGVLYSKVSYAPQYLTSGGVIACCSGWVLLIVVPGERIFSHSYCMLAFDFDDVCSVPSLIDSLLWCELYYPVGLIVSGI